MPNQQAKRKRMLKNQAIRASLSSTLPHAIPKQFWQLPGNVQNVINATAPHARQVIPKVLMQHLNSNMKTKLHHVLGKNDPVLMKIQKSLDHPHTKHLKKFVPSSMEDVLKGVTKLVKWADADPTDAEQQFLRDGSTDITTRTSGNNTVNDPDALLAAELSPLDLVPFLLPMAFKKARSLYGEYQQSRVANAAGQKYTMLSEQPVDSAPLIKNTSPAINTSLRSVANAERSAGAGAEAAAGAAADADLQASYSAQAQQMYADAADFGVFRGPSFTKDANGIINETAIDAPLAGELDTLPFLTRLSRMF